MSKVEPDSDVPNGKGHANLQIRRRSLGQKIVETGFLVATWLALGLYLEIFGPTLIDLKIKLNTDYEEVAGAVSGRAVGLFPGCVIGGVLVDKLGSYCHVMIALCLEVAAIVTVAIPWCPNVDLVWCLCFFGGLVESIINVAGQRIILNIWLEKSAGPLHLLHMGYGIGSFIIPLYTNPFLAVEQDDEVSPITTNSTTPVNLVTPDNMTTSMTNTSNIYEKESRIEYPYAISAGLVALMSVPFLVYQLHENRLLRNMKTNKESSTNGMAMAESKSEAQVTEAQSGKPRSFKEMINPASCTDGHFYYGIRIFFFVVLYFANVGGGERVIAGFLRTYAVDQLDFSKDNASYINTAFWISFTLGRLCFFGLAKFISIRKIIMIETTAITIIAALMNIFATSHSLAYWILLQPLGFFLAPLWPSGIGWSDFHVELTGVAMGLVLLGGSLGGICHLRIIGYIYEHIGPRTFLYQIQVYAVIAFVLASILNLMGYRHGSRFDVENKKEKTIKDT